LDSELSSILQNMRMVGQRTRSLRKVEFQHDGRKRPVRTDPMTSQRQQRDKAEVR
jgi:hypothetical protein